MKTKIQVAFSDGEIFIIEFRLSNPARMELVIKAWGLLWQREVLDWRRTTEPANVFYHGRTKQVRQCNDEKVRSELIDLIPLEQARQQRQNEIVELRAKGLGIRDIARELGMDVPIVSKLHRASKAKLPSLG